MAHDVPRHPVASIAKDSSRKRPAAAVAVQKAGNGEFGSGANAAPESTHKHKIVRQLLERGRRQGFLTVDDVTGSLDSDGSLLAEAKSLLGEHGIRMIESKAR